MSVARAAAWAGVAAVAVAMALLPGLVVSYVLTWFFLLTIYMTLALSYDIVGGYLGYMNLGHSAFFGLGAYATAILLGRGAGLPAALVLAAATGVAFAAGVGYPLFRLRGAYYALATFGLIGLMAVLANNLRDLTGGSGGISTPPGDYAVPAYYLGLALAAGALLLNAAITRSGFGLALLSIREDEEVAGAIGVPTTRYKILALMLSSLPASLAGGIYVWNLTYISPPAVFGLEIALTPIVMAMLGGSGTLAGPVIGAVFLTFVQELLWTQVSHFQLTTYGLLLIFLGLFMPGGLVRCRWFAALGRAALLRATPVRP